MNVFCCCCSLVLVPVGCCCGCVKCGSDVVVAVVVADRDAREGRIVRNRLSIELNVEVVVMAAVEVAAPSTTAATMAAVANTVVKPDRTI